MINPQEGDEEGSGGEDFIPIDNEQDEVTSCQVTSRHKKYREAKKAMIAALKQKHADLESTLKSLRVDRVGMYRTRVLTWKCIAKALKDSCDAEHRQNRELRATIHMYQRLLREMTSWVSVPRGIHSAGPTWRDTTISSDPISRRMGKEWIVQRMFHNTDMMFQQHGFPPWDSTDTDMWRDMEISVWDSGSLCTTRRHFVADQSFESTVAFVREECLSTLLIQAPKANITREADANTQLYTVVSDCGELVHILCGEFRQGPDRCVFVLRQITHDDSRQHLNDSKYRQRSRMLWYDYVRVPNGRTRKRVLGLVTSCHVTHEFDLNVEAAMFGLDLTDCPDCLKESRFRNHVIARWDRFMSSIEASLKNPL
ncbi:hypothetical protein H310_10376 [Aphanomyces invadans]|uniref:Uncharacterized protein n=1 Tax=Aphanomyces invadans TaxID=157072 RepID=A0A024TS43_9STRA|nr:hypothetical protein H310_10376 [Aphanomyces invadans]ETV96182.1 hypothetical protein H310_10376 [Aphanomyces invadans]|eukprot:XP_008874974.1 hypothetical protein H310_10376 [Aphanomyces invadans]